MDIFTIILIGISLSLDAFSLSLAYGLMNIRKKQILLISFLVGLFHFIMPFLGNTFGYIILKYLSINPKYVLSIIFILIIIEMIKSLKEEPKVEHNLTIVSMILFAFLVSVDSFTIGIGLSFITKKTLLSYLIFSILSFLFTYLGFVLGKYFNNKIKNTSKIIGILIMFTLVIVFLCKP